MPAEITKRDYSLIGEDGRLAVDSGLAGAEWYACPIPRKRMKELMKREDGPAIRDTLLWLGYLAVFAAGGIIFWGTWWCVPFFICYGVLYGSAGDSRWHECGHGTAFKTAWMNNAVYQLACFFMIREPAIWRWSHTRHHTDTLIVGRDPEIVAMRPAELVKLSLNFIAFPGAIKALARVFVHATGRLTAEEKTFVPESEWPNVYRTARIWIAVHLGVVALALALGSWLPVMLVGLLPTMYGAWLAYYFGLTQHAGLAEDVLDHRLNSRTVYMNPIFRFVYWNMNYHVEHHMFPMIPYHRLPELHEEMKPYCPTPYANTIEAYREIIAALWKQAKDPTYHVVRKLPDGARSIEDAPGMHGVVAAA